MADVEHGLPGVLRDFDDKAEAKLLFVVGCAINIQNEDIHPSAQSMFVLANGTKTWLEKGKGGGSAFSQGSVQAFKVASLQHFDSG